MPALSRLSVPLGLCFSLAAAPLFSAQPDDASLATLRDENGRLQKRVDDQQKQIDELRARLDALQTQRSAAPATNEPPDNPASVSLPAMAQGGSSIRISGEAGLAFFSSGSHGQFPNSEFRVDDAKVFVEAQVWQNAYLFGGMDLTTREASDENFHLGEFYADLENVWESGRDRTLSVRAGRFNIPFGEEYQVRNVVDNPLVTHSVADIWGIDEGVQVYGQLGPLRYNVAVQNGGHKVLHDYDPDKSVTFRLSANPLPPLHVSASAMRTGRLNTVNDVFSETWIANGFFRAIGPANTTPTFHAKLAELDASWRWKTGHLNGTAGWIDFNDANPAASDQRHMTYFSLEAQTQLAGGLYGAARYSGLHASRGYPLVGLGNFPQYMFAEPPTTELERLSLGIGYRFAPPLVWKLEYAWETGKLIDGASRNGEDMLSTELAMRF